MKKFKSIEFENEFGCGIVSGYYDEKSGRIENLEIEVLECYEDFEEEDVENFVNENIYLYF